MTDATRGPRQDRSGEVDDSNLRQPLPGSLRAVTVQYDNRPDRCTISPADCTDDARFTTWLSANRSAFVDLDDRR